DSPHAIVRPEAERRSRTRRLPPSAQSYSQRASRDVQERSPPRAVLSWPPRLRLRRRFSRRELRTPDRPPSCVRQAWARAAVSVLQPHSLSCHLPPNTVTHPLCRSPPHVIMAEWSPPAERRNRRSPIAAAISHRTGA